MRLAFWILLCGIVTTTSALGQDRVATPALATKPQAPVDALIPWLLEETSQLRGIPFREVIFDTTGKKVLATDPKDAVDQRVIREISTALDAAMRQLNAPDSVIQGIPRINEVSSHFEDKLRELLNAAPGLSCDFPRTEDRKVQRSGYPDLRLVDRKSKRVFYLDPKLYAVGGRESSFRTFYFEPKKATNKYATTPCISSSVSSTNPQKTGRGNSPAGIWLISRTSA